MVRIPKFSQLRRNFPCRKDFPEVLAEQPQAPICSRTIYSDFHGEFRGFFGHAKMGDMEFFGSQHSHNFIQWSPYHPSSHSSHRKRWWFLWGNVGCITAISTGPGAVGFLSREFMPAPGRTLHSKSSGIVWKNGNGFQSSIHSIYQYHHSKNGCEKSWWFGGYIPFQDNPIISHLHTRYICSP